MPGAPACRRRLVTVTDTPVARETDYGRVDQHSSAIRAAGDARHTYNRVPDYPVPGADDGLRHVGTAAGSRCRVRRRIPPRCPTSRRPPSPAAAIDGDPATAWVSNALQAAVGQWLQVDFDHPVTNAVLTVTPSATAVGAQVRRIRIETATGSTTLRFDEAGKPLTAALPYGESPWVRITAAATDDGSAGVQFGITDLSITQYDASGFAHPVRPAAHRAGARATAGFCGRAGGTWDRSCSVGRAAPRRPTACAARRRWRWRRKSR